MDINGGELLLLVVIAVIVIGPERLPQYAEQLGQLVRNIKKVATGATERVKEELGEEAKDLDLSQFDPRKYDPRRIVREALADDILPTNRRRPAARKSPSEITSKTRGTVRKDTASTTTAAGTATATAAAASTNGTGADTGSGAAATDSAATDSAATSSDNGAAEELVPSAAPFDDEAT